MIAGSETSERLVGADVIARAFGVSTRTIQRQAEAGQLPALRVGGVWRFDPSEVAAAIHEASEVAS